MNIGFDLDGTLTVNDEAVLKYTTKFNNEECGGRYRIVNPFATWTRNMWNWDLDTDAACWNKYHREMLIVPLRPNVADTCHKLKTAGHRIDIVSNRFDLEGWNASKETRQYLMAQGVPFDYIGITSDKAAYCHKNRVKVLLENDVDNCRRVKEVGTIPIVMASPSNVIERQGFLTIFDFPQILNMVRFIASREAVESL